MPAKRKSGDSDRDGNGDHSLEPTVKNAVQRVGYFDTGIPAKLYTLWQGHIYRAI